MENQGRHSPEGNETDTSAADQSSRNPYQERNDCGNYTTGNDTIATQSSSLSSCSNIVEITSDDEEQIVEIEGTPPKQENEHPQSSSQMSLRRKSPQLDVSCPVCLSEYDNKAFLDKCFRIFLQLRTQQKYHHMREIIWSLFFRLYGLLLVAIFVSTIFFGFGRLSRCILATRSLSAAYWQRLYPGNTYKGEEKCLG